MKSTEKANTKRERERNPHTYIYARTYTHTHTCIAKVFSGRSRGRKRDGNSNR